jgi:hypothetical protein
MTHPRPLATLVLLLLLSLLAAPASAAAPAGARGGSVARAAAAAVEPPVGERQMALGASALPDRELATFDAFAASVGRAPATWSIWSAWAGPTAAFPDTSLLNGLRDRGAVPMIWWYPADPAQPGSAAYRYRRIAAGAHDAYIREFATAARDWGGTLIVRFAWEMNGRWFPWGMDRPGNTPRTFKQAWRHVVTLFRQVGATNARFLWSPNSASCRCPSYESLYPGDRYVSYVGFTAFNWGYPGPWKSMLKAFTPSMDALAALTGKPVIVAETGSAPDGGDKAAWIRAGYPAVYAKWPRLLAIVYFDVDMREAANQPDWRLLTPSHALDAYREIVAQSRFQGRIR